MLFLPLELLGQKVSPEVFDFGKEKAWNNPEAVFNFTNNTAKSILFLPLPYEEKLKVVLPEGYIRPGEKSQIRVRYFTETPGIFSVKIPVYINTSPLPLYLELTGNIKSFHPNALTVCPRIDKSKSDVKSESGGSITVYDKKSGQLITGADVLLSSDAKSYLMEKSKKSIIPIKNVNIGLYNVVVSKEGYIPYEQIIYINRNSGDFVFELERAPSFSSLEKQNEKSQSEEFVEMLPEDEQEEVSIERIRKMMDEKFKGRKIIERDVVVIKENPSDSATFVNEKDLEKSELFIPPAEQPDLNINGTLNTSKYAFNHIVFLIDVSGSMNHEDKLPLLIISIKNMIKVLRPDDKITLITYASKVNRLANAVSGLEKELLYDLLDSLTAKGNSFGAEGLIMAYEAGKTHFIQGGNNHIILASDGMFNSKEITNNEILDLSGNSYQDGLRTSTIFFGKSAEAEKFMNNLAIMGKGSFIQIKTESEAQSALIEEIKVYSIRAK
jgi:Ca-activated chloride channel family protein